MSREDICDTNYSIGLGNFTKGALYRVCAILAPLVGMSSPCRILDDKELEGLQWRKDANELRINHIFSSQPKKTTVIPFTQKAKFPPFRGTEKKGDTK